MNRQRSASARVLSAACAPAVVGLAAFLLFSVQLVIGKRLLPWFGGSSALWTTSLMFFQAALLAGYAWAHLLTRLAPRRQRALQLAALAAALVVLAHHAVTWPSPITAARDAAGGDRPLWSILTLLASSAGAPFVVLASTSPLLQGWAARERPDASPLWLYALSNVGSLVALAAYPLAIEPFTSVVTQGWAWAAGFAVYSGGFGACAWAFGQLPDAEQAAADAGRPSPRQVALWLALSLVPSLLLLAITAHLTQEVAPAPLLWTLPLAVYLASFVLAFARPRLCGHRAVGALLLPAAALAAFGLQHALALRVPVRVGLWLVVLLVYGIAAHGELVRWRPAASRLTAFYMTVAAGGVVGGGLGALAAPRLFAGYWELHLAVVAGPLVLAAAWLCDPRSPLRADDVLALRLRIATALTLLVLMGWLLADIGATRRRSELARRSFYGVLRVVREHPSSGCQALELVHGRIAHGLQCVSGPARHEPVGYYGPSSGVGLAIARHPRRLAGARMRVGVVGLGTGTLAAWSRAGDHYRFYELDPEVARLSQPPAVFSYLSDAAGETSIVIGDGRLVLERETAQSFDVLVVDAFSSDAVPTHLLTVQAFAVYRRHLRDAGVLAVNVTNRYLDLKPVVRGAARAHGLDALHVPSLERWPRWSSEWMLVGTGGPLDDEAVTAGSLPDLGTSREVVWTDDWSGWLRLVRH